MLKGNYIMNEAVELIQGNLLGSVFVYVEIHFGDPFNQHIGFVEDFIKLLVRKVGRLDLGLISVGKLCYFYDFSLYFALIVAQSINTGIHLDYVSL